MAPLVLVGDTLGQRHRHYNILVKEACTATSSVPQRINYEDNDIDNLLKIDVANKKQDVDFILEVLKSEDLLYVSRAIKHCTWIITEQQYASIINPDYLNSNLFPQMTSSAICKLLLHIRLYLKEESRVEMFYDYYKDKNINIALKWLPNCSLGLIEKEAEAHFKKLEANMHLFKRLCERSVTILEICVKKSKYHRREMLVAANFWISSETERYLAITEYIEDFSMPYFNAKITDIIMKKCPQKIIDNFEKYADSIDMKTFVKHFKKGDVKEFLVKHFRNKNFHHWYNIENLKHFIMHIPKEGRFGFLKQIFIEKSYKQEKDNAIPLSPENLSDADLMLLLGNSSDNNIYRWYRFAPFDVAFPDLKKLIRAESDPSERNAKLAILISCAGENMEHIQSLIQYYHDKHMNDPFKYKILFMDMILSKVNTHKFDEKTCHILHTIFSSMEVFIQSDNNVQSCIQYIIINKVLRDENVPEIIEKKFRSSEFNFKKTALFSEEEKTKIFNYLLNFLIKKLESVKIGNEIEMDKAVGALENIISLILNWKKELSDYPSVLNKIKDLAIIKKQNYWKTELKHLYNKNKSWRKLMFEESLLMSPSEQACINALKHDPELLTRYKSEVDALCLDNEVSLRRLLNKLRLYWQQLISEWTTTYLDRLDQNDGHKAVVSGLCTLLPPQLLIGILKKYAPIDKKIKWGEEDEQILSLRKHFAKNLHLARPLLSADAVLMYARGDYLQYALPSINSIIYNISAVRSREHIPKFIDAPVSLQKHGIRLAFTKLSTGELKKMFPELWQSTKNFTIRAVLFRKTYDILCKEKKPDVINDIWEILSMFIDNLSPDDNKVIFYTLSLVGNVPEIVRGKYCMKSYKFLKSLPPITNSEDHLTNVIKCMPDVMESIADDIVAEVLFDSIDNKFSKARYEQMDLMVSYLLCTKDENSQLQKYESFLKPLLKRSLALWNVEVEDDFCVRYNIKDLLVQFCKQFDKYVFLKSMIFPIRMFEDIQKVLEENLPVAHNYVFLTNWKLTISFVKLLEGCKELIAKIKEDTDLSSKQQFEYGEPDKTWHEVHVKISQEYAKSCLQFLREDVKTYFSNISLLFSVALDMMFSNFCLSPVAYVNILKSLLEDQAFIESYLVVLQTLPKYPCDETEAAKKYMEIRKLLFSHPFLEIKMRYCEKFDMNQDFEISPSLETA